MQTIHTHEMTDEALQNAAISTAFSLEVAEAGSETEYLTARHNAYAAEIAERRGFKVERVTFANIEADKLQPGDPGWWESIKEIEF